MQATDEEVDDVLEDIKFGVLECSLSRLDDEDFPRVKGTILRIITLENEKIYVVMNIRGFKILSKAADADSDAGYHETLNGLLMEFSPKFKQAFHDTLFSKLQQL